MTPNYIQNIKQVDIPCGQSPVSGNLLLHALTGTSEILEDSIPGILEGILTPSSPVDREQESTLFSDHLCYSPF